MSKNLIYDIHDKPKFSNMLIFAFQQLLAILAATIAVPTIIGLPTQIPAAIFGAGVGTLIYQLFTRFKSPVFLGSSFAFLNSLGVALAYGYCGILLGSIVAGLVYVVIAIVVKIAGVKWIAKLMPPVVIGPTVALIGLSLAGAAINDVFSYGPKDGNGAFVMDSGLWASFICAMVTLAVVTLC
jgi:uracil permease